MNIKVLNTRIMTLTVFFFAAGVGHGENAIAPSGEEAGHWTVRGQIPPAEFVIQLHRGAGKFAPENTLEAFEMAWRLGAVPEADLRTTQDGVIVAFHDKDFRRVAKGAGADLQELGLGDLTFAELLEIDVGSWRGEEFAGQRIPRISDVFEAMRGRPEREIYIDVKEVDLEQLVEQVNASGVGRQVIFTTTHHDFIREWIALHPGSQTLNWISGGEAQVRKRVDALRKVDFEGITQLQIHVRLNSDESSPEPYNHSLAFIRELGSELRERGILFQALPWELSDREIYWKLLDLGLASFATDYPEAAVDAVRSYYERAD